MFSFALRSLWARRLTYGLVLLEMVVGFICLTLAVAIWGDTLAVALPVIWLGAVIGPKVDLPITLLSSVLLMTVGSAFGAGLLSALLPLRAILWKVMASHPQQRIHRHEPDYFGADDGHPVALCLHPNELERSMQGRLLVVHHVHRHLHLLPLSQGATDKNTEYIFGLHHRYLAGRPGRTSHQSDFGGVTYQLMEPSWPAVASSGTGPKAIID